MKIAIVTNTTETIGGVQIFTRDISSILRERGHSVSVVSVESLPIKPEGDLEEAIGEHFNELHRRNSYDLVLCNGEMGYAVEHPKAINVFHGNYHGYARAVEHLVPRSLTKARLIRAELQRISAEGKYVVTVSNFSTQGLRDSDIKVDQVINLSADTSLFYPQRLQISDNALALARGMDREKGFDILEELAGRGVRIRLFSDRKIDSPHIENMGFIDNRNLNGEYNKAQLLLNPSRFEGGGLTTLEAMACGCPIIATPTGYGYDIRDRIPNFVVEPDDINGWLAKREILINDRDNYSKQALAYFHEFHAPEKFRSEWISLIEGL